MPALRIAIISDRADPPPDGYPLDRDSRGLHVAGLSSALARAGHDVRIYRRRDPSTVVAAVEADQDPAVTIEHLGSLTEPATRGRLLPQLNEFGHQLELRWADGDFTPDVVHAHFWTSGLAAVAATRHLRQPLVVTFHALAATRRRGRSGPEEQGPSARPTLERMLGRCADRVIAQTNDELSELVRADVPRRRIVLVPSGVDTERFQPAGPALTIGPLAGTGPRRPRILAVGRRFERGGVADLVATLRHVPDAELLIAGGPPAEALDRDPVTRRLRALCDQAGVADRVHLLGAVSEADMPKLYRAVDVVACTPPEQPFGVVPLEAMACGVPVVAYAVGGLREAVIDGVTGVLVRPRDTRALAVALRRLLGDDLRRMGMASAAVDRIHARYGWPTISAAVTRVYADAIADAGRGAGRGESGDGGAGQTSAATGRSELAG